MTLSRYLCLAVKADQGERRKRARVVGALSLASPVSFCFSYSIWLSLFALNIFITNRFSCGTMKTEFYFPPEFYSIFKAYPIPENSYVSQRSFIWSFKIPRIEAQLTNQFPQPEFQSPAVQIIQVLCTFKKNWTTLMVVSHKNSENSALRQSYLSGTE